MNISCRQCQQSFEVSDSDRVFLQKVSPSFNGVKYPIPSPTLCPQCRLQRRLSFWNARKLYKRKCDRTGKELHSIYSQDKNLVVYDNKEWWKDDWDPLSYGREYDFSKSFFKQFAELRGVVPRMAMMQNQVENSDYTNYVSELKDCYLLFAADFNRDCCYGGWVENCKDCFDNYMIDSCEQAYESFFSNHIYASSFVYFSTQCSESAFLIDCRSCQNCFMCWGLRSKSYCIENVQYTKEEYLQKRKEFDLGSYQNLLKYKDRFLECLQNSIHPVLRKNGRVSDSTGDFLTDVENCHECYEVIRAKDGKYLVGALELKDVQDACYVGLGELAYECCECVPVPFQSAFNVNSYTGSNLFYCDMCMNACSDCFGCVGLKHKQYCILNKQYTKEEYEVMVPRIIDYMKKTPLQGTSAGQAGEWGEFFPVLLSPFAYNESEANVSYPLTREEILQRGWKYKEDEIAPDLSGLQNQTYKIPDHIKDVSDDICKNILVCEISGKPYKIILQELKFYRTMNLPVPRKSFEQRFRERLTVRNPRKLWERACAKCGKAMKTTFAPDRTEKVYCEECYLQEVY